ncbi:MAG TPA: hypothetical protein VMB51_12430 [Solirubrobacteraceae bacterium]|nr:hypothetical protein [Solirubrobacteraceae bacterium]
MRTRAHGSERRITARQGARLVLSSVARFPGLSVSRGLRLRDERLRRSYRLCDGRTYRVFRETAGPLPDGEPTVIEVCFRLRLIGSARAPHRLFQRLCILTTPFWSGFDGFGTKLWMVDPHTCGYAGAYEWDATDSARTYLDVLLPILGAVSVPDSVDYELHPEVRLDDFLRERQPR